MKNSKFKKMPQAYQDYYAAVRKIKFFDEPNYNKLRNFFVVYRRDCRNEYLKKKKKIPNRSNQSKLEAIAECSQSAEYSLTITPSLLKQGDS